MLENIQNGLNTVWQSIAATIGPYAFAATQYINQLALVFMVFAIVGLFVVRTHERNLLRRYQAGMGRRTGTLAARLVRSQARKRANEQEYEAVMKMTSRAAFYRTLLFMGAGGAFGYLALGSWGLAMLLTFGSFFLRAQNARNKIERARNASLAEELLPAATEISNSLLQGLSLPEALNARVRGAEPTPFTRSLRRALSSANGLEAGLRIEQELAYNDVVREFFEILADGATTTRRKATTAQVLLDFVNANRRVQEAWKKALSFTSQARAARDLMLALIPGTLFISGLKLGLDVLFRSNGGNVTILIIGGLMLMAYIFTNGVINRSMKEF